MAYSPTAKDDTVENLSADLERVQTELDAAVARADRYEAAIQSCEATFKHNKSRMWVLKILREKLAGK